MLAVFMRQQELDPIHDAWLRHETCRSDHPGRHCPECAEYYTLTNRLRVLCKVKNFDVTGVGADQPEPPRYGVSQ